MEAGEMAKELSSLSRAFCGHRAYAIKLQMQIRNPHLGGFDEYVARPKRLQWQW
jgi:hypothetical protein